MSIHPFLYDSHIVRHEQKKLEMIYIDLIIKPLLWENQSSFSFKKRFTLIRYL